MSLPHPLVVENYDHYPGECPTPPYSCFCLVSLKSPRISNVAGWLGLWQSPASLPPICLTTIGLLILENDGVCPGESPIPPLLELLLVFTRITSRSRCSWINPLKITSRIGLDVFFYKSLHSRIPDALSGAGDWVVSFWPCVVSMRQQVQRGAMESLVD